MAQIFDSFVSGMQAGQEQAQTRRTRTALDEAGRLYASGDYQGAENALLAAGRPDLASNYDALSEARRSRTARDAAQQAVTSLGADATPAQRAEAAAGAYMQNGDFQQGLGLTQAQMSLEDHQRQAQITAHDNVASFALGQIQRGVPVEQRQADALAHADQFSQQTGIPVAQVQQMIQGQTDWSDQGLQALAAEHRTASEQLAEMTRQTERQQDISRQERQFNATLANRQPQVDQQSVEYAARQYRLTGHMPTLDMGASAASTRLQILAEAARQAAAEGSPAEADVIRQRALNAQSTTLAQVTRYRAQVMQFEQTAERNLDLALQASQNVRRTGSPVLNDILQIARTRGTGDPAAQQLAVAVNSYAEEYAKVMSGATGAQAASDSARQQAHSMINTGMTIPQIQAAAQQMRQEMANRRSALNDEYQGVIETMHSPTLGGQRPEVMPVVGADGQAHGLAFNANSMSTIRRQLENGTLNHNFITEEEARRALHEWDRFNGDSLSEGLGGGGAGGGNGGAAQHNGPPVGAILNGYRFKGGDPNNRDNWEPVSAAPAAQAGFGSLNNR